MCVQRRRFEVNLIVTCDGANGLINALPGRVRIFISFIGLFDCFSKIVIDSDALKWSYRP